MDFADESFDIIWSEGSIFVIGFERGLRQWKRFLKPDGFMVIHDEKGNVKEKLVLMSDLRNKKGNGYALSVGEQSIFIITDAPNAAIKLVYKE